MNRKSIGNIVYYEHSQNADKFLIDATWHPTKQPREGDMVFFDRCIRPRYIDNILLNTVLFNLVLSNYGPSPTNSSAQFIVTLR